MPASETDKSQLAWVKKQSKWVPAKVGAKAAEVEFAGELWPPAPEGSPDPALRGEISKAGQATWQLAASGVATARAALQGQPRAATIMKNWFGARGDGGWWAGAYQILCALDGAKIRPMSLYYRNAEVVGKPDDLPGASDPISEEDTTDYAAARTGGNDLRICLCEDFFEVSETGEWALSLKGYGSAGGILLHELSHNLCYTDDHELDDPEDSDGYGPSSCLLLAEQSPWRAWYNADSIEFFCEQALFGLSTPEPKKVAPKLAMPIPGPPGSEIDPPPPPKMSGSPPPPPPPSVKDQVSGDVQVKEKEAEKEKEGEGEGVS